MSFLFLLEILMLFSITNVLFFQGKIWCEPSDWCFRILNNIITLFFFKCFLFDDFEVVSSGNVIFETPAWRFKILPQNFMLVIIFSLLYLNMLILLSFLKCYAFSQNCTLNHRIGVSKPWIKSFCWVLSFLFLVHDFCIVFY